MTRLIGPSNADRLAYTLVSSAGAMKNVLKGVPLAQATFYDDPDPTAEPTLDMLTSPADIRTLAGAVIPDSTVAINAASQFQLFQFPDGNPLGPDSLLVQVRVGDTGVGPAYRVYAREDEQIELLRTRLAVLEPGGSGEAATKTALQNEATARANADAQLTPKSRTIAAGTGLTGGGDLSADRTLNVAYGTTAGTAAQGNDARLSDARTPTAHATSHGSGGSDPITVAQSQVTGLAAALGNKADLVGGVIPTAQLPALAINETFTVASQAAMLALTAQRGDVAIRTDLTPNRAFLLASDSPSTLADWKEITAAGSVTTVNGQSGIVVLAKGDVGLGNVDNVSAAQLRDRSTHTGTQDVGTITGLGGAATLNVGTAAGTVAAGNDSRIVASNVSATALGIYSPLDPAYGYTSGNDLAPSAQAAINAMPATGGVLVMPRGTSWTLSAPLALKHGVTVRGAGDRATTLTAALGAFTWSSAMYQVNILDMTVVAQGGHIFTPIGNVGVAQLRIKTCVLRQTNPSYSIYSQINASDYNKVVVQDCFLQRPQTSTVPGWHVVNSGGAANENTWDNIVALSSNCNTTPMFHVESAVANYCYDNVFRNITGEQDAGGLIHLYSAKNTIIENCAEYDADVPYAGDVIKIDKSPTGGLRSSYVRVVNSGRRGGTLAAGVYDINNVPGGSFYTLIEQPNMSAGAPQLNFSLADYPTVIGTEDGSYSGQQTSVGHFFSKIPVFGQGAYVGPTLVTAGLLNGESESLVVGQFVPKLDSCGSNALVTTSGTLELTYFTADKDEPINTLTMYTGNTAAAPTPTLCRMGVYSVANNGDLTLIASTPNDTALFAATFTTYAKALSATWNKVGGLRYALGKLVITAAATPTFQGLQMTATGTMQTLQRVNPAKTGRLAGQTDLPASITAASLSGGQTKPLFRLS